MTSVLLVFFSNYKVGLFGDLSSMSGKGSILKDSKENIFFTCAFRSFILGLRQCDLKSAESRLSLGLILAQRRKFRNVEFRFGLVEKKKKKSSRAVLKNILFKHGVWKVTH